MTQIEKAVGASQIIFPCIHPLYCWALLHAAWLSNRYIVKQGTTAFERSADRMYTRKLCLFGESVLGYIKPDRKEAPRWCKGIPHHWIQRGHLCDTKCAQIPKPFCAGRTWRHHHKSMGVRLCCAWPSNDVQQASFTTDASWNADDRCRGNSGQEVRS